MYGAYIKKYFFFSNDEKETEANIIRMNNLQPKFILPQFQKQHPLSL